MISPRCTGAPLRSDHHEACSSLGAISRSVPRSARTIVRVISRYATAIPDNAVSALADAVGKVVAVPVVEGSVLQVTHLTTTERDGLGRPRPGRVPSRTDSTR